MNCEKGGFLKKNKGGGRKGGKAKPKIGGFDLTQLRGWNPLGIPYGVVLRTNLEIFLKLLHSKKKLTSCSWPSELPPPPDLWEHSTGAGPRMPLGAGQQL